jgi:alanyl-tRNA synthetase
LHAPDVTSNVDYDRRRKIAPNHSLTHVLNFALKKVLGDGVGQKGSLCNDEKLRFDFSHSKALSAKELLEVEDIVQECIAAEAPVYSLPVPLEQAKAINGLRAVFGEVRLDEHPSREQRKSISFES